MLLTNPSHSSKALRAEGELAVIRGPIPGRLLSGTRRATEREGSLKHRGLEVLDLLGL